MPEALAVPTADGAVLAGERLPGTGPTVVLLHAGVADSRAWRDVAPALNAEGADVVAYDRRGFGRTPGSAAAFRHADDLESVLDATADGPAWLVGNSQGGLIALDVALRAPERVAGLVLLAPAVSGAPEPQPEELDPDTFELTEQIDRDWEAGNLEALNGLEVRLWLDGPAGPAGRVGGRARALALEMNATALASGMAEDAGAGEEDAWRALEDIRAPATVAWGALDLPVIVARCRVLAERLGNVREAVELPGVAHLPALEQPGVVTSLVAHAMGL